MRIRNAEYMELFTEKASLNHMHLSDAADKVKALSVYEKFRILRCNFVELKCIHICEQNKDHELHLVRHLMRHLGCQRYSYVLFQAHKELVKVYNAFDFFVIDHGKLPDDVKECMPLKDGRVCMKYLLPNWRKNRYDLLRKPTHYPDCPEGIALREAVIEARSSKGIKDLHKSVENGQKRGFLE